MFYIKVKGITYQVEGTRTIPKTWKLSCEHTSFQGMCIQCAKAFAEAIDPNLTSKRYIVNWDAIEFLN